MEVREHRARGQCLYCPDKYYLGHTCATPHLLLLDATAVSKAAAERPTNEPLLALEDVPPEDPIPIILNALSSPKRTRGRAMRLVGHIGSLLIRVFVDSRADLNFLNLFVVTRLGLRIDHSITEPVIVANGRLCYTQGLALDVQIRL